MLAVAFSLCMMAGSALADETCTDFDVSGLDGSNEQDYCVYQIAHGKPPKVGSVCLAHPEDLLPTQYSFGEVDAFCEQLNLEKLAADKNGGLKAYLSGKFVPSIMGPGSSIYITDHHHLSVALLHSHLPYDSPSTHRALYICVGQDLSSSSSSSFWAQMKLQQTVWLKDNYGNTITVEELPSSVKYLRDDPYRTLAQWGRESFGFVKCGKSNANKRFPQCQGGNVTAKPFIEFNWANAYRQKFPLEKVYIQSDQAQVLALKSVLQDAIAFSLDPSNKDLPGWNQLVPQYTDPVKPDDLGCF